MTNYLDLDNHGYLIERELGKNRAGGRVTYLATDTKTQQPVVIKQFQFAQSGTSWSDYDAYEQEIKLLQQLQSPSIPRYLDAMETPKGFCLVQEYKQAIPLSEIRNLTSQEIKEIAITTLEVLVYLQQQHPPIIHRDIKPENILIERSSSLKVYLVDFGFARQGIDNIGVSSVVKGTLGFMPPEQMFNRQITEASDLYSLGFTLICLLTGTKSTEIGKLINEQGQLNFKSKLPKLNWQFVKWLEKMVAPSLNNRYANAKIALEALKPINVNSTSVNKLVPALGLAAFSLVGLMGVFLLLPQRVNNITIEPPPTIDHGNNEAIVQLLTTGKCPRCDLSGVNLEKKNLPAVNLEGANLQGAKLGSANLNRAILKDANLHGADLSGTNLYNSDLSNANLKGTNLENANLWDAHLENANLVNANLRNANTRNTILWNANLANATTKGTFARDINLKGAIMPDGSKYH